MLYVLVSLFACWLTRGTVSITNTVIIFVVTNVVNRRVHRHQHCSHYRRRRIGLLLPIHRKMSKFLMLHVTCWRLNDIRQWQVLNFASIHRSCMSCWTSFLQRRINERMPDEAQLISIWCINCPCKLAHLAANACICCPIQPSSLSAPSVTQ